VSEAAGASPLLFEILLLLALTATGLALFERLRLPAIAGFLVVGALAGPGVLGLVSEPGRVQALAEIGVVFLLFEIGLELPLERLRVLWRSALAAGVAQVALTVGAVSFGALALGLAPASALVLGGIVAMSSTALATRLLVERGTVDAPQGRLAISILILQDLAIVPFLLAIPLLGRGDESGGLRDLAVAIARMAAALVAMLLVARGVIPRLLDRAARLRSPDLFSLLALLLVIGSALIAERLGLTLAVGAFLAGVAATASPYSHQLFSEVVPLRGVLIGLFFTAVGMLFDPRTLATHAGAVLAYLAAAIVLKGTIVATVSARASRVGPRTGILAAAAIAQTGEFSFVLAAAAHAAGLIDDALQQVVIAGSVLSLLATPFLMRAAPRLADRLSAARAASDDAVATEPPVAVGEEGVVLIGFGHAGQTLARTLRALDVPYVIVEANASSVETARVRGERIVFGDATRPPVLQRVGVSQARLVVVAISDPLATRRIVSRIHHLAPDTPVLARTRYVREVDLLDRAGATMVVAEEYEGAIAIVAQALGRFPIPPQAILNFTDALRDEGYGAIRATGTLPLDPWLVELLEEVQSGWVDVPESFGGGRSLEQLAVRARTGVSVLAVEHDGGTTPNPPPQHVIAPGDRLLVLGDASALERLETLLRPQPRPERARAPDA